MNKENIIALSKDAAEEVRFVQDISNKIVSAQATALDTIISEIKTNITESPNPDDSLIEEYMLKLINTLYAMSAQIDNFSFYEAISDIRAQLAFNDKYAESQMSAVASGKKATKDDHQQYAINQTVDEKILNLIYDKSVRILKSKVDGGYEMLDVLKRILKHHEQEAFHDKQNRTLLG